MSNAGTIEGANGVGVQFAGTYNDTVTNSGTIAGASGHDAVLFGAGTNLLVVDPGAVFVGTVDGGSADDSTLELASAATTGTLTGLGTEFIDFSAITVAAGADWVLTGGNTIASGVTLTNFGTLTNSGTLTGGGVLSLDPATFINSGYTNLPVTLAIGDYLDNTSTGTISLASGNAVTGTGGPVSVVNAGTITAQSGTGIYLQGGGSIANTGTASLINANLGIEVANAAGTVTNAGTIEGTGFLIGIGIYLNGGSVANAGTAAYIEGAVYGVKIGSAAGTVSNAGTIAGHSIGDGVYLKDGGSIANTGTAALISGGVHGIKVTGALGTVTNAGTVTGTIGAGIYLKDGGSVANTGTAALISGTREGIYITGAAGTVTNAGTIEGTNGDGVQFAGTYNDTLTNAGTIIGGSGDNAVLFGGGHNVLIIDPGAVFVGTVGGGASGHNTIELASAASTGTISGLGTNYYDFRSVIVEPDASWVVAGYNTLPITIDAGGYLDNTGTISLASSDAVIGAGPGVTVTNAGTIFTGDVIGIGLTDGGSVVNRANALVYGAVYGVGVAPGSAGTITNAGTIIGGADFGVSLEFSGGSVANTGAAAYIYGGDAGIYALDAAATVTNAGTIIGYLGGVVLLGGGGTVANTSAAAYIHGGAFGIYALGAAGTVTNTGTITGTLSGVALVDGGGSVANTGATALISGAEGVVIAGAAGTVSNAGTIEGIGTAGIGVYFLGSYNDTVTNAGTIAGASGYDSVLFGSGTNTLVVDPGAVFVGTVDGGSADDSTLELAAGSSGTLLINGSTITGPTTTYINFSTITIDPGAAWTFVGTSTIASGVTLNDDGMLTNAGTLTGAGTLTVDPGTMVNSGYLGLQVALQTGSTLDNTSTGTISVNGNAVIGTGGSVTVINAGTIIGTGGDAVLLSGGGNRVIVDPGAVFVGTVDGGSSAVLELASAASIGTISGLGTSFIDFASVTVDAGAHWALAGSDTLNGTIENGATLEVLPGANAIGTIGFASASGTLELDGASLPTDPSLALGATVTGFVAGDMIDLASVAFASGGNATLAAGNLLKVSESGQTYDLQLDPSQSFAGQSFQLTSDGLGGTDISVRNSEILPDFNGDGFADILFATTDGSIPIWEMNGNQIVGAGYTQVGSTIAGVPAPGWSIVDDTGDFYGTGKSDLLWQTTAGQVAIWEMNGTQVIAAGYTQDGPNIAGVPAPGWAILGVGDFYGTGNNDILWQTNTGAPAIWEMNGTQVIAAGYTAEGATVAGAPGPDWHIIGAGDFTGDGRDDLLWRTDEGQLAIWEMNGTQVTAASYLMEGTQQVNAPGSDWHIITTADFFGDGKSDILWQTNSGQIAIWEMNGFQVEAAAFVGTVPIGWTLETAADVFGTGKSDLLFQNGQGGIGIWQMNGFNVVSANYAMNGSMVGSTPIDWNIIQHNYNYI